MYVELCDFKTGWYELSIYLKGNDIDVLVERLIQLKNNRDQHFHITSDYEGLGGIGDIEFNAQEGQIDNMTISGFAIPPNR